jgi:transcriptional regulator GlxA family with amidase domain
MQRLAKARHEWLPIHDRGPSPPGLEWQAILKPFHRGFADRDGMFERHALRLRVELFKDLLRWDSLAKVSISALARQCGFADAAHATRTLKDRYGATPRDFRTGRRSSLQ